MKRIYNLKSVQSTYTANGVKKTVKDTNTSVHYKNDYNDINYKSIFFYIVLFIFFICYSRYVRTGLFIDFSFKSLIDYLSHMPDVTFVFSKISLNIGGSWGVVDFLRVFINLISSIFEFQLQFIAMISQSLIVVIYLVGVLFI